MTPELFVDVYTAQCNKHGEASCGDAFKSTRLDGGRRIVSVLSDGLGSGLKASILANMTASMAVKFIGSDAEILPSAELIMDALPVCQERRISYATFTILDCRLDSATRVIEMGNPAFILLRGNEVQEIPHRELVSPRWRDRKLRVSHFDVRPEDRVIAFSDGITQAGLGRPPNKLGWRRAGCLDYARMMVQRAPHISARGLAKQILSRALSQTDERLAEDDMSCSVHYFRKPRRTLVFTGPPFHEDRDREAAERLAHFPGQTVICGGTTANIVSRELRRDLNTLLGSGKGLPPISEMRGISLITEGILTLTAAARILEGKEVPETRNAAVQLVDVLRDSDVIEFLVGKRINEAHQDPSLPVDLEIRRNIVQRIAAALRDRHLKQTSIEYI
jgi:hypothetical protein